MRKAGLKSRSRKPQQPDDVVLGGGRRSENNDAFLHTDKNGYANNNRKHVAPMTGGVGPMNGSAGVNGSGGGGGGGGGSHHDGQQPQPSLSQHQQQPQQPQQQQQRRRPDEITAMSQKNHRLAKELSELRVRHREETKVVSRLTMENMNLASRCREAIGQVVTMKKEIIVYQRRQSEWQRQMQQLQAQQQQVMQVVGNKQQQQQASNGDRSPSSSSGKEKNSAREPVQMGGDILKTDLDRIMSQQLKKEGTIGNSNSSNGNGSGVVVTEKKDVITKKLKELSVGAASAAASNRSRLPPHGPASAVSLAAANLETSSPGSKNELATDDEFDADVDMVDLFGKSPAAPALSPGGEAPTTAANRANARKANSTDDRMPIDVVSPPSFSPKVGQGAQSADTLLSSLDAFEASFESAFPEQPFSITSEAPTSHMAFDVPDFGDPFFKSSGGNDSVGGGQSLREGKGGGPNRLANLENLRVSNTSTGNASTAGTGGTAGGRKKSELQDLFPESAMDFKAAPVQNPLFDSPVITTSMGMMGSASDIRGRIAPVAPEKLETPASRAPYEMAMKSKLPASSSVKDGPVGHNRHFFDGSGNSNSSFQKNNYPNYRKTLDGVSPDEKEKGSIRAGRGSIRSAIAPLSPGSMSAEIQQLDAIASNLASGDIASTTASNGTSATSTPTRTRKLRNVKQPVSYAEPTLNSKLRRGDVLFPKVESAKKHPQSGTADANNRIGSNGSSPVNGKNPEEVLKDLEIPI